MEVTQRDLNKIDVIDSDAQVRGFSIKTAYYMAHASLGAYGGNDDWPKRLGLGDTVRSFNCGQFHGFVGFLDKLAIVAFRGTESVGNCLTDAETPLVRHLIFPGLVHYGFSTATESVWPVVRALLGGRAETVPVWVTGHSLGGAMATLVSIRLAKEGFNVRAVYTYGSPRAGDRHFHEGYQLPNYRFVNDNDIIPHLPFRWCYKHVGELKLLDADGNLQEETDAWDGKKRELASHAKRIQRAHRNSSDPHLKLTSFDWLADHHLDRYIEKIGNLLPRVPRRRSLDVPAANLKAAAVQMIHEGTDSPVPRPHMLDGVPGASHRAGVPGAPHRVPVVSESELAKVFFNQPAK